MSQATKRKHVRKELLSMDYRVPEDLNSIVKITQNCGNNLHQIETHSGDTYFVSMPGKFRNNIYIKPGDFVIVNPIEEGNKVKGEIEQILDKKYISFLKQQKSWPFTEADDKSPEPNGNSEDGSNSEDDEDVMGGGNPNRRKPTALLEVSESSDGDGSD